MPGLRRNPLRRRVTLGQGMEALEPRRLLAANPVLTLVALTQRLAGHLGSRV